MAEGRPFSSRFVAALAAAALLLAAWAPAASTARPTGRSREGAPPERVGSNGTAPRTGPIRLTPAPGWAGARLFGSGDDWEPAAAADPGAPYVYLLTTRYSGPGTLPCERCDIPSIVLKVSSDGGATFASRSFMPVDVSGGQYDPQIETDAAGNVYAVWINGNFRDVFSKSTDHGLTWSDPVVLSKPGGWADHPWLGVSPNGLHVYVGFNHAASWVAQSHDGGLTWAPAVQTSHAKRYYYAGGAVVHDDGSVWISQMSYPLDRYPEGPIRAVVTRSTDGGATFQTATVDTVQQQPDCFSQGCHRDHYGGMAALAGLSNGVLVLVYDGALVPEGAQFIFETRSTDGGVTWSHRRRLSPGGKTIIASFPAAVGTGDSDVRIWYMDDRYGTTNWNVWFRQSTDGGKTWSEDIRISDAISGTGYVHKMGFDADYGDYGEIAVTSTGATFAIWGAGFSYAGPGGSWYNRTL